VLSLLCFSFVHCVVMSRLVVARCSLWCKTGVLSRLCASTRMPLKQYTAYRHSRFLKGFSKLHNRVINEQALQEQLDIMKLSIADLESADTFGSLSADCDIDEELIDLAEEDQRVPTPALKYRKSASSELSNKADTHSRINRQMVADIHQEEEVDGPYRSHQPVSKRSHVDRRSVPLEGSDKTSEHLEIYNKFSSKTSLPDVRPDRKDWSEKFGSLSGDVDKFLDKYVSDASRYSCQLIIYLKLHIFSLYLSCKGVILARLMVIGYMKVTPISVQSVACLVIPRKLSLEDL